MLIKKIIRGFLILNFLVFFTYQYCFFHYCNKAGKIEIEISPKKNNCEFCTIHFENPCENKNTPKSLNEQHSCCSRQKTSHNNTYYFFESQSQHKSFSENCCILFFITLKLEYNFIEKFRVINYSIAYLWEIYDNDLIINIVNSFLFFVSNQISLPTKEFLSKLLATIYFTSLVR